MEIIPRLFSSKNILIALFLILFGLSSQCIQAQSQLTESQRIAFDAHYINANKFLMLKMPDEALKELKQAAAINPNAAVNFLLAKIYFDKKIYSDAEQFALKSVLLDEENIWYTKQLCDIYREQKKYLQAAEIYAKLYRKREKTLGNLFDATYLYVMGRELDKALKLLSEAEKDHGLNEDIIKQKQSIYLAQNKVDKAINEAEKLIKAYPKSTRYLGLLADIYLANGKEEKANELYRRILSMEPDNGNALLALADDYRNKKLLNDWYDYTSKAIASHQLDIKSKLRAIVDFITSNAFGDQHKEKSYRLADVFTSANPDEASAWMVKGDLYAQNTKYETAHQSYSRAAELEPSNYATWRQLILCDIETKNYVLMEKDCGQAIELFPTESLFYVYHAIASQQLKNYEACLKVAQQGIDVSYDQEQILLQLYLIVGDVNDKLKRFEQSDSAYQAAIKLDPDNSLTLNNYAYQLSLRNTNLEKAAQMSKRSLEIEKNNASYLDTYGWILFMQQQYEEAKVQIEKSLLIEPENAEVIDHYGDILYKLGKIDEAVIQWKKAKELGTESVILEKKIRDKKWYDR